MKLVDGLIDEQFAHTLEEHGVTRRQWQLLNVLARGESTVEQLDAAVAPFLVADEEETVLEHLAELTDSAWIDQTASGYLLTERGRAALDRLSLVVSGQRTAMTSDLTEADYLTTIATLERMARNLGWSDEPG